MRDELQRLERGEAGGQAVAPLGLPEVDQALGGGLATAALHEVLGRPEEGAATGFVLTLLARLPADPQAGDRPVLWCGRRLDLHGPGLAAFIDPGRLILAEAMKPADLLWAMEEGLRCPGLAAVVGELDRLDLTAGRRLQLAAEAGGTTGLVLRRQAAAGPPGASTATTRWRIASAPGRAGPVPRSLGPACWRVELLRCRGGRPGDWMVEWHDATGDLSLAAALRDRPAADQATA